MSKDKLLHEDKVLEIAIDNGVKHTCYYVLNKEVHVGCSDKFFEGTKDIKPLKQAKIWAKENGYNVLQIVRISRGKNKTYKL